MKNTLAFLILLAGLGMAAADADAARRFGGGGNLGRQRPAPTLREAPKPAPAATPAPATAAKPAQAAPATAPAPQPSFMSRWGGVLAGLGLGALVGALFGGHLGTGMGSLVLLLLVAGIGFMLFRAFAGRRDSQPRAQFAAIGSALPSAAAGEDRFAPSSSAAANGAPSALPPEFEVEPFLRAGKTSFIRLQAANDAGDLDDIRDYTTPEMYAEIAMQVRERGGAPQRTEVVTLDAQLVEAVVEGDYAVASVRFSGAMREEPAANAEPFDEIWHVRKDLRDPKGAWLIAGIQQVA